MTTDNEHISTPGVGKHPGIQYHSEYGCKLCQVNKEGTVYMFCTWLLYYNTLFKLFIILLIISALTGLILFYWLR